MASTPASPTPTFRNFGMVPLNTLAPVMSLRSISNDQAEVFSEAVAASMFEQASLVVPSTVAPIPGAVDAPIAPQHHTASLPIERTIIPKTIAPADVDDLAAVGASGTMPTFVRRPGEEAPGGSTGPHGTPSFKKGHDEAGPTGSRSGVPDIMMREPIARGGMGEVWRAFQPALRREVAVKRPFRGDRSEFLAESFTAAGLDHPNIAPVHDLVEMDGDSPPLLVMKLVRGRSWATILQEDRARALQHNQPILDHDALARHLEIFQDACAALAYAHHRGVLHRDLKPGQVMVGDFGEVYLMDWGLASTLDGHALYPDLMPGSAPGGEHTWRCGTPSYMAPEQASDTKRDVGPFTDIYLLGAILFEVLAGRPPHAAPNALAALMRAMENEFDALPPEAPADLADLTLRCMATDPAQRPQTAMEVRDAIRDIQSGASRRGESRTVTLEAIAAWQKLRDEAPTLDPVVTHHRHADVDQLLQRAIQLWPDNADARAVLRESLVWHVERAIDAGDLRLARFRLDDLRTATPGVEDPDAPGLEARLGKAEAAAAARERQVRRSRRAVMALGALLILAMAGILIRERYTAQREREMRSLTVDSAGMTQEALQLLLNELGMRPNSNHEQDHKLSMVIRREVAPPMPQGPAGPGGPGGPAGGRGGGMARGGEQYELGMRASADVGLIKALIPMQLPQTTEALWNQLNRNVLSRLPATDPSQVFAYSVRLKWLLESGNFEEADRASVDLIRLLQTKGPGEMKKEACDIYAMRGMVLYELGRYREAEDTLNVALSMLKEEGPNLNDAQVQVYAALGDTMNAQERTQDAREAYIEALRINLIPRRSDIVTNFLQDAARVLRTAALNERIAKTSQKMGDWEAMRRYADQAANEYADLFGSDSPQAKEARALAETPAAPEAR